MADNNKESINTNDYEVSMLTTFDNPYNPFVQYEQWYAYDVQRGYNSCAYLARIAKTSYELSEKDQDMAINQAVDEIVHFNFLGIYKKVTRKKSET